jgi:hypothetical protein
MSLYVFALMDAPIARAGRGLRGPVVVRPVAGAFAAVERRADVPPIEFGTLQSHETIVDRLATRVPAILPVRFGTLLSAEELDEAMGERMEEVQDAFGVVRGCVQFTWRSSSAAAITPARTKTVNARSGTDYLRRLVRAAHPEPPPSFKRARMLGTLAAAQRFMPASGVSPAALYHLVDRRRVGAYSAAASRVHAEAPGLSWSGPFAPYAFAPELL